MARARVLAMVRGVAWAMGPAPVWRRERNNWGRGFCAFGGLRGCGGGVRCVDGTRRAGEMLREELGDGGAGSGDEISKEVGAWVWMRDIKIVKCSCKDVRVRGQLNASPKRLHL